MSGNTLPMTIDLMSRLQTYVASIWWCSGKRFVQDSAKVLGSIPDESWDLSGWSWRSCVPKSSYMLSGVFKLAP